MLRASVSWSYPTCLILLAFSITSALIWTHSAQNSINLWCLLGIEANVNVMRDMREDSYQCVPIKILKILKTQKTRKTPSTGRDLWMASRCRLCLEIRNSNENCT